MAWFQNLAGKAEDLLNKIDQNAATVLNEPTNGKIFDNNEIIVQNLIDKIPKNFPSSPMKLNTFIKIDEKNSDETADESLSSKCSSLENSITSLPIDNEKILESENNDLNKQILNLKHLYSEVRNENSNLKSQIENANYLVSLAQSEMEQYKARAQRILQEKEQLINLNKENTTNGNDNIMYIYNEEMKKELEFQQNKNKELTEKTIKLTKELELLHKQMIVAQNSLQQSNNNLDKNLMNERRMRQLAEEECENKNIDLNNKMQELLNMNNQLKVKNEEINELKELLKQRKQINTPDYETRINTLTDTLMIKQYNLEAVTNERNALRIQLEKLQNEHQNNLLQMQRSQSRIINVNEKDDEADVPKFLRVSLTDAGVTRRVKHAYSTVDAISIRMGIFLRRYPVARVFVFCYMIMLQFWAMFILFWYAPSGR